MKANHCASVHINCKACPRTANYSGRVIIIYYQDIYEGVIDLHPLKRSLGKIKPRSCTENLVSSFCAILLLHNFPLFYILLNPSTDGVIAGTRDTFLISYSLYLPPNLGHRCRWSLEKPFKFLTDN